MADISNFRRNLLSPVPEQEVGNDDALNETGTAECRSTELFTSTNLSNPGVTDASPCTDSDVVSKVLDGANHASAASNELSNSYESGGELAPSGIRGGKTKEKKGKESQSSVSGNEKRGAKLLPFNFFNKRKSNDDSLIRLFSSEVFDSSLAISYLFSSKEQGVLDYIGNRIFEFTDSEMDTYLPQLLNLYANVSQVASSVEKYIRKRCSSSINFSIVTAWLLGALVPDASNPKKKLSRGAKLRKMILEEEFRSNPVRVQPEVYPSQKGGDVLPNSTLGCVKAMGHQRSRSAAAMNLEDTAASPNGRHSSLYKLGDLQSGTAFNSGCQCFDGTQSIINDLKGELTECKCGAPRLSGELEFINSLLSISKRMQKWQTREQRTNHLFADLGLINMNLPARVWIPNNTFSQNHHVVRIPQTCAFVLNSKEKAPYMVYFEVIDCNDKFTAPVPAKKLENSLRTTKSVENIIGSSTPAKVATGGIGGENSKSPSQNSSIISFPQLSLPSTTSATSLAPSSSLLSHHSIELCATCDDDDQDQESNFYVGDLGLSLQHTIGNGVGIHYQNGYETASLFSHDSIASCDSKEPTFVPASDIRRRLSQNSCNSNGCFRSDPDDPSAAALKEPWERKVKRIRESSPYGENESWRLIPMIIKVDDDLRLELLCSQFISILQGIWIENKVELKVSPVNVLVTGPDSGFIEPLMNTVSLHQIKKQHNSLPEYFRKEFGSETSETYLTAQLNFVRSVAAYSLICYLLQVKDRHNGNILLDSEGHIIHIDYAFVLNNSPKNIGFESSAFKLTQEYVQIIGGTDSDMFNYYKLLMLKGLIASRKHVDKLVQLFDVMTLGNTSPLSRQGASAIKGLRDRFHISKTEVQLQLFLETLVEQSYHSLSTAVYDRFQYFSNGIF